MVEMKSHPLYQEDLRRILQTNGIKQLQGKRLLITGATGLIGVCLIDALMLYNQQGADIHIYATGCSKQSATSWLGECSGSPILDYDFRDKRGGWGLGYKYK